MNLFQAQPGGFDPMLMLLIMAVFFFFMIWPQMRRQKKLKPLFLALQKDNTSLLPVVFTAKYLKSMRSFLSLILKKVK